jgi:hypothetical protein
MTNTSILQIESLKLKELGILNIDTSGRKKAECFGIGCETLDRDLFDPEAVFPKIAETGALRARLQTGWAKCEKSPGVFDFSWLDEHVDALLELGMEPWFNLGYGNPVYQDQAEGYQATVGVVPTDNPDALAAWLRYVEKLVEHFSDRVSIYEIWNEPDIPAFWVNQPRTGAEYARLFNPTVKAVKAAMPSAGIAALAMTSKALNPDGRAFISEFIDNLEKPELIDIVTFHSYRYPPDFLYEADVAKLSELVKKRLPGASLWMGEGGYPSQPSGTGAKAHHNETSELIQAKWLTRHLITNVGIGVEFVSWFHAVDLAGYRDASAINPKGLLRTNASPKQSFFAMQNLCTVFSNDFRPVEYPWRATYISEAHGHSQSEIQVYQFEGASGTRLAAYFNGGAISDANTYRAIDLHLSEVEGDALLLDTLGGSVYSVVPQNGKYSLPVADYPMLLVTGALTDEVLPLNPAT